MGAQIRLTSIPSIIARAFALLPDIGITIFVGDKAVLGNIEEDDEEQDVESVALVSPLRFDSLILYLFFFT